MATDYFTTLVLSKRCKSQPVQKRLPTFGMSDARPGLVYVVRTACGYSKIGRTSQLRFRTGQIKSDYRCGPLSVVRSFPARNPCVVEFRLHHRYFHSHVGGEWFRLTPADDDDLMSLTDADIERFHNELTAHAIRLLWGIRAPTDMFRDR